MNRDAPKYQQFVLFSSEWAHNVRYSNKSGFYAINRVFIALSIGLDVRQFNCESQTNYPFYRISTCIICDAVCLARFLCLMAYLICRGEILDSDKMPQSASHISSKKQNLQRMPLRKRRLRQPLVCECEEQCCWYCMWNNCEHDCEWKRHAFEIHVSLFWSSSAPIERMCVSQT